MRRYLSVAALLVLAPLVGEYLLGNLSVRVLPALPFLIPLYGGGALLIRELTRRTGRGWPTILLLGCAYGLVEAGMFDGSLFNPSFEGLDFTATYVSALGISATNALHFVVGHAVWSIAVPIALVEALVPTRRTTPWLGKVGLAVTAVVYLLGGLLVLNWSRRTGNYVTSPAQLAGTALVVAVLVVIAFRLGRTPAGTGATPAPRPLAVGVGAFVASSLFSLAPETWPGVVVAAVLLLVTAAVVVRWSRRADWDDRHRLALAGGVLPTYMWLAFVVASLKGQTDPLSLAGNVVFAVVTVGILVVAMRRTATARSRLATPV